ncbi:MAG TPA: hypothetical protein VNN10_08790 [Dehalococcoidia bacterium]|nr:hypothetical protein [Dehalococcoidia bacterium]
MADDSGAARTARRGRAASVVTLLAIIAGAVGAAAAVEDAFSLRPGPNEFDVPAWEVRNFPNKWLYEFGAIFRGRPTVAEEDEALRSFLTAVERAERPGREAGAAAAEALRERNRLENQAEAAIERRITEVLKQEGIRRGLWVLPDTVWPPVDMEFTSPPRTLAVSPRDRIELIDSQLLRAGLDIDEVERIEKEREGRGGVSALSFPVSGVGAYPTVVAYTSSYRQAVEVAAHEWVHNYLVFRPLGIRYYHSNDLRAINETVADLVGREVAEAVVRRWPLTEAPANGTGEVTPRRGGSSVDLRAELVKLRGEVDTLLAAGRIDEAEALMEERRQYLAANGHYIRRINQAYFAFINLYAGEAGSPGATNPIGPKVDQLRRLSPSLAAFLRVAGDIESVTDLDRALAALAGASSLAEAP